MTRERFCNVCENKIEGHEWIKLDRAVKGQVKESIGDMCLICADSLIKKVKNGKQNFKARTG